MEAIEIISLLEKFGPQAINLITFLIEKAENKQPVTAAEWKAQSADLKITAKDVLIQHLNAAGIPLDDPKAVLLINAATTS